MNYYEELGLSPEATAEEIRRAHRKLTKLMHPDAQIDESVRRLAEMQMRRLNTIVDTLTDDEKRKRYDNEIKPASAERPSGSKFLPVIPNEANPEGPLAVVHRIWKAVPWWVWSTAGALTLTSAAVYFWADNLGSSFNDRSIAYVPASDTPAAPKVSPRQTGRGSSQNIVRAPSTNGLDDLSNRLRNIFDSHRSDVRQARPKEPSRSKSEVPPPAPQGPAEVSEQPAPPPSPASNSGSESAVAPEPYRKPASTEAAHLALPPVEPPAQTPASVPPAPASQPPSRNAAEESTETARTPTSFALEGDWVYTPDKPEARKPGLFPPTFIELRIYRTSGEWRGVYHARYQVENRPVDPDVNFLLSGGDADAKRFIWESPNGSKGTMRIKRLTDSTIKVEWDTMVYSDQHVLTSGIATLSKR